MTSYNNDMTPAVEEKYKQNNKLTSKQKYIKTNKYRDRCMER